MRGKAINATKKKTIVRITPAYAGKSGRDTCSAEPHKDHPRLCGEKQFIRHPLEHELGSPPPMRGKARLLHSCSIRRRITPAYAGKSFTWVPLPFFAEDHPRLCGEK